MGETKIISGLIIPEVKKLTEGKLQVKKLVNVVANDEKIVNQKVVNVVNQNGVKEGKSVKDIRRNLKENIRRNRMRKSVAPVRKQFIFPKLSQDYYNWMLK
jgi:hypothetical protein